MLDAENWQERERQMTAAYETIAEKHNQLGITKPLSAKVSPFYERPFVVIQAERFVEAIRATITSAAVLALPPSLGGIDQFIDSTDVLSYPDQFSRLRQIYAPSIGGRANESSV